MNYISTRDSKVSVSASESIVKGISKDGGLFVPSSFPIITLDEIASLLDKSYKERSAYIINKYLTEYTYDELLDLTSKAYSKFDSEETAPLVKLDDGTFVMELWHGPTCAFKDMALTLLPYLMTASRDKVGATEKTLILVATSGDTGKAALEGFSDVDGTEIIVFYPSDGVSDMQKLQMATQEGKNVHVAAIKGNFDDAQSGVKKIFADSKVNDELLKLGYKLSSANSINWGRLVPQISYYISAYCDLVASDEINLGDKVNFCVPSGNFGNILAGYYAKRMGLPVNKLICASNENNVLTDFMNTGVYDINRDFYKTTSPSMDILISSNLERLLFELFDRDDEKIRDLMDKLKNGGKYSIDKNLIDKNDFTGGCCNVEDTSDTISNVFDEYGYLLDTHTAVAMNVYTNYVVATGDETPTVIVSTASPYKFPCDVYEAIEGKYIDDAFTAAKKLQVASATEMPESIVKLKEKEVLHKDVIEKDDMASTVIKYCGGVK